VKIDRIQVDGFGRLAGLDTGHEPLDGLVVVLGPNEAGKSTLFAFLTTALYGFQPATREANPHVPWGASEASGRVRLRLDGGGCAEVERKLRSQPSGRLTIGAATAELRNQALPWVEHVPRGVFRQVFAVTLSELAGLDAETWARIQDKVVGSMGASDLRSARVVADALDQEAGEIWRPNRRGNQRLRDLQQGARELRARRGAAHERDERVRRLVREREEVLARLDAARAARHRDRAAVERVQTLLPLKQQLDRIAALRAQGGALAQLDGLPAEPAERLATLQAEMETQHARRATLQADLAEQVTAAADFDEQARALVDRRDQIAATVARTTASAPDRARARELEAEIRDLESRLDAAGARLLVGSWLEQQEPLAKLPVDVLKDRLTRVPAPPAEPTSTTGRGAAMAALALGAAVLAWGLAVDSALITALGAAITAVGAVGLWVRTPPQAPARRAPGAPADDPLALLGGVRLQATHRQLGEDLLAGLARLRGMLHEREERTRALSVAHSRIHEVDAQLQACIRELGRSDAVGERGAEAIANSLAGALRDAEVSRAAAIQAERESQRTKRDLHAVDATLTSLAAARADLERRGAALAPGDPARGLEAARTRLAAHRRADALEAELQLRHADLGELQKQIATLAGPSEQGTLDPSELASARARIETLGEEIEQLARHAEALDQNIAHLRDLETVDAVDSEAATLRETESRLARERDRKWLLARILREADRRFREEHQPDLLRRASAYLAHLTGGRYDRLVVDETEGGHLFRLVGPGLPAPVALSKPVSTGTLEQAYLALRLAIVDHLDRGGERLPLFVDEVFVNWDAERRDCGLEVLAGLAAQRQVFVFTCHPEVAQELARRRGRVISLGSTG